MLEPPGSRRSLRVNTALILCIAAATLALRVTNLDHRPMHGDEANQAYKTGNLLEDGAYIYDPHDHHGPTLYYLAALSARVAGHTTFADTTEFTYRIVPVLFSVGLILLLIPLRQTLDPGATIAAALLIALSPAFTFYSRYFIQEILLVFFTFSAIVCGWKHAQRPTIANAVLLGASLSLMHATKETAIIAYAAMGFALTTLIAISKNRTVALERLKGALQPRYIGPAILIAAVINIVLFSAFFTHPRGILDSFLTYANYFDRAGGAGIHDKPWHYYLGLLAYTKRAPGPWWSEGLILFLGLIGFLALMRPKDNEEQHLPFLRFLAVYALFMTLLYAIIPYKTPWSMLSFYHAIILLAGIGVATLLKRTPGHFAKVIVALLLLVGGWNLARQSYQAETKYAADPRNPYVYAHTSTAHFRLVERLEALAELHPDGNDMLIRIIQPDSDYWPLPWYLRKFSRVGYWNDIPEELDASVIITAPQLRDALSEKLAADYVAEIHGLRPSVLRHVYIEKGLWKDFLESRK